ncbi:MAG: AAA family ATPase [Elusimicrobia bacterium]|nr:AAA family ATPase [Elusimicrobiota bacterium]
MKGNIYLSGFMGTGKSVVGKSLAKKMGRPFVDLDHLIEKKSGCTIAELFSRRGEMDFRRLEHQQLSTVAKRTNAVVSLGGGALLDRRNRDIVRRTGVLIRLTCSRRELIRRLRRTRAQRPLLAGGSLDTKVARLISERRHAYGGAELTVSTTRLSNTQAASLIARRLA